MQTIFQPGLLLLAVLILSGCKTPEAAPQSANSQREQPGKDPAQSRQAPQPITDLFTRESSLSYAGYEIVKLTKKVDRSRYDSDPKRKGELVEVSYTGIKRAGQMIAEFDGLYYGLGNSNDFGLFPLLGTEIKQLVISQAIPRGGRHWIVELSPGLRTLLDSDDYEVGREDIKVIDIDKDGVYEICLPDVSFYGSFVPIAATPLAEVIFKYDEKTRTYVPANHRFQEYLLDGIAEEMDGMGANHEQDSFRVLTILLQYVYAGKEEQGWALFERGYRLADKEEVKLRIKGGLVDNPVYRYIHRRYGA